MRIKPRGDRLLIKLDRRKEQSRSGLVIVRTPDGSGDWSSNPRHGWVEAVGPEVESVSIGDYVMGTVYNGVDVPMSLTGDRDHILVKEKFVLAVIPDDASTIFGESREFSWPGGKLPASSRRAK